MLRGSQVDDTISEKKATTPQSVCLVMNHQVLSF